MAANSFAKDSLGWQIQQTQRWVSEWLELQFMNDFPDAPQVPGWLGWGVFWLVGALALAIVVWALIQVLSPMMSRWLNRKPEMAVGTIKRTEKVLGSAEWLRRSRDWQQQGNYAEACRALYMAMLEQLHEKDYVPRKLSRTDGAYQDCVQALLTPAPYQLLLQVHEHLYFGTGEISADTFNRCQQAYQTIEQQ